MCYAEHLYVNLRLLAEFLLGRGDTKYDVGMPTFGVRTWSPPKDLKRRLSGYHEAARQFVTHYSARRVSILGLSGPVEGFDVDPVKIDTMARDALDGMDQFIAKVPDGDAAVTLRKWHDWARKRIGPGD